MIKKYISQLLILFVLFLGISCSKKQTGTDNSNETISQDESTLAQKTRRGLGKKEGGKGLNRTDGISLTEDELKVTEIKTIKVELDPIKANLSALGKVKAHQHRKAIVSYAFPARIADIHIRIGDWVKKGQKLITLQSEEVGSAKSEFYKANADYELAKVNNEREKRLFDRGVGAKKNYFSTEAELKVAEVNLDAPEKKLHVLGFSEEQVKAISESHQINPVITLYSPIAGKIIQNNAILGGMVDQGTEILVVMDPTLLCIDAEIYEKDIAKVKMDQTVEVSVPAYPGEKFIGQVKYISDILNEETRTITVRTQVENKSMKLKAGMFADIKIFLNHANQALSIPREAILEDKGDKIVFVKRESKFYLQVIQTGARENGFIQILGGIDPGDEIVTQGNYQLKSKLYEEILKAGHVH